MTTKTDFHSIRDLKEHYHPAQRGIVNEAEIKLIRGALEIETRTTIELQNVRDMTVMLYGKWTDAAMETDSKTAMELMDAMSAITCVIDQELFNRRSDESYTAFAYEDDGTTADLSTYDNKQEAIDFAKSRGWDEVVDDRTGNIVWRK